MEFLEQQFKQLNAKDKVLEKGVYEACTFSNCDLSDSNLSDFKFLECDFIECNLSNAKLANTSIQDAQFIRCKMLGLPFDDCSDFALSFSFSDCILNHSSFYKKEIKKTVFNNCQLLEVDFADCDLSESKFSNCELNNANFELANLEKADLSTAIGYTMDPENVRIKKAKFSPSGLAGLLVKYDINIQE